MRPNIWLIELRELNEDIEREHLSHTPAPAAKHPVARPVMPRKPLLNDGAVI